MFFSTKLADFFARLGVGLLLGLIAGLAISEISYLFLPNKQAAARAPMQIDLVIPPGTADKIEAGEFSSVLDDDRQFVEGDVLVVKNEDDVAHQLGPLFVPPKSSSRLSLDTANSYTYSCSFQSDKYVGLVVQPRVTFGTRMEGVLATGLPTGMMLMVYSYLMPNDAVRKLVGKLRREKQQS